MVFAVKLTRNDIAGLIRFQIAVFIRIQNPTLPDGGLVCSNLIEQISPLDFVFIVEADSEILQGTQTHLIGTLVV